MGAIVAANVTLCPILWYGKLGIIAVVGCPFLKFRLVYNVIVHILTHT